MIEYIGTKSKQLSEIRNYLDTDALTPLINIFMNDMKNHWYSKVGQYLYNKCSKLSNDKVNNEVKFILAYNSRDMKSMDKFRLIGIIFLTSMNNFLFKIFGDPIYHNKFGEGFGEENINYSYASYFIKINGHKYHIGFDHRGSSVESEKIKPELIFEDIKELIDDYINSL